MELDCDSFDEVAARLQPGLSGSHLHGVIVGGLCGPQPASGDWVARIGAVLGGEQRAPHWGAPLIEALKLTALALEDEEFGFEPMLPDDDVHLGDRAEALAEWCDGFLLGFAAGRGRGGPLSAESEELVTDLQSIADGLDGASFTDADDDDENDYAQLVEFVRIAALSLFAEHGGAPAATVH